MSPGTVTGRGGFNHQAFFYASDGEYLEHLVTFVHNGLARQQPIVAAVPSDKLALLREALGAAADHITMLDMTDVGRNPGRIIAGVLRKFADRHPGRHARLIGEPIWPGRSADEYPACVQHEALINTALAGHDATIVCPYDTTGLTPETLADARTTHPLVRQAERVHISEQYAPQQAVEQHNRPLPVPAGVAGYSVTTPVELSGARTFATETARRCGLPPERTTELQLITTELVTNTLKHTNGGCLLHVWLRDHHVVCTVRDTGCLTDPLAGRRPASNGQHSGRGLLLVNELADLVRTHTSPHGTTIQAHLRLASPGGQALSLDD